MKFGFCAARNFAIPVKCACLFVILFGIAITSIAADITGTPPAGPNTPSDVVGKVTVGYQAWFVCPGDGSPRNSWVHWSGGAAPSASNQTFEIFPDVREFTNLFQTGYAPLGNGEPARLFSSYSDQTIAKHFEWMKIYEIDCAALQRFGSELRHPPIREHRNDIAVKVKQAAEASGRKFFIMYDISGWKSFATDLVADCTNSIAGSLALTASKAYARHGGKPVICIWGVGFTHTPGDPAQFLDVIHELQSQGFFVIGGVPSYWRTGTRDSKSGFENVYRSLDMIQPWTVGRFNNLDGADHYKIKELSNDLLFCRTNGIAFQPVVFPGFSWSNWHGGPRNAIPRLHGDFLWRQFFNLRSLGINTTYVAMFDEYDEGTAIAKAAEDSSMIPKDQYFLTLDADGIHCSSDFYLRLVRDGRSMLNGKTGLTPHHPTPHENPR
jgi:hypothetical protein